MRNSIVKTKVIADGMSAMERNVKRAGDFLLATISLLLVSPLMLLIYIMVRCEDGGPAISSRNESDGLGALSTSINSEA